MFFEYKSTSLSELAKVFSKKTSDIRFGKPFHKIWVVVQNKEAQQWLTLQVAKFEDIAFNFEFILPSELMWKLYRISEPELPKSLPSDRTAMQWQLFELIKSEGEALGLDSIPEDDKGLFQLSEQIADVLDLYQVYRPELLDAWEKSRLTTIDDSEKWQRNIWLALNSIWEKRHPNIPNRKQAFYTLKQIVYNQNFVNQKYPESIFVFGLSQTSSSFLDLITSYARNKDVHFFNLSLKSKENKHVAKFSEWLSTKIESNALLKEFVTRKNILSSTEYFTDPEFETILTKVSNKHPLLDHTIEVHSCHNSKREAEVLKDHLLLAFDEEKELNPEDVLIMAPEMDEYAPVIESVFLGVEDEPQIPVFTPSKYSNQRYTEFSAFLELISSRYKIDEVLDFLEFEKIRMRFKFTEEDILVLKNWLIENRIHWGLELSDSIYSLEKAVSNFMSGFAIETKKFEIYNDFIPFKGINTSEQAELAAGFSSFLQLLKLIKLVTAKKMGLKEWLLEIKSWVLDLFQHDDTILKGLINILDRLIEYADLVNSKTEFEFTLFKNWFIEQLSDNKASSSGFGHGVVLSSYIPYRSIPFKKVCVLGLNESVFPRNVSRPNFDLIHAYPKSGDRIMKEDDKLLFLELLASTSNSLFISYLGQDQRNESIKLPSILVQKLIDELKDLNTTEHKLHGLDKSYFKNPDSYSNKRKKLSLKVLSDNKKANPFLCKSESLIENENIEMIEINDLISFFVHPCKYLLNNQLLINEGFENSEPISREVFKISALDKYNLDQLLLEGIRLDSDFDRLKDYSILAGFTPQGIPGEQSFYTELGTVSDLMKLAQTYTSDIETKGELDLNIDGIQLKGSFNKVYGNKCVFIKAAKLKAKDFVNSWLNFLILSAENAQVEEMIIVGRDSYNRNQAFTISGIGNSKELLSVLINWFIEARRDKSYSAFFPESSKAFVEALHSERDKSPIKEAKKRWIGSEYSKGEGSDFYNELYWRGENPLELTSFEKNANSFWEPVLTHLKKVR
ncbi:MAG: exodeoxyribonuclease V subunit gamma [Balneolaceae bacterium]